MTDMKIKRKTLQILYSLKTSLDFFRKIFNFMNLIFLKIRKFYPIFLLDSAFLEKL